MYKTKVDFANSKMTQCIYENSMFCPFKCKCPILNRSLLIDFTPTCSWDPMLKTWQSCDQSREQVTAFHLGLVIE